MNQADLRYRSKQAEACAERRKERLVAQLAGLYW
jgi:hypothetical protein